MHKKLHMKDEGDVGKLHLRKTGTCLVIALQNTQSSGRPKVIQAPKTFRKKVVLRTEVENMS